MDLADARNNMVDGQLRPNKVTDRRILDAMRRLPRELFVPPAQRALAYADVEVPLPHGRALMEPMVVARLVQAATVSAGGKVLVLGAGYAAALFAACGAQVFAIEQDTALVDAARAALSACGSPVTVLAGPLAAGWPKAAPYDCIFVDGGVQALPELGAQLRAAPPGRLCAVLVPQGRAGVGVVAEWTGVGLAPRPVLDCTASLLPQLVTKSGFSF